MDAVKIRCGGNSCFRIALVVFGGFLIHLALGAMYTIGNFSPYIISYLRNRTDDQTIKNVDILWLNGVGSIGNCLGLITGGLNAHKFGDRIAIFIGSIVFCGSTAMNYFSVQKSYIAWITTQGLVGFFGHKLTYGTPIQTGIKWWPSHSTLVAGLIVSGTGGGSMIFNQVITGYVNSGNLPPDFTDEDGERYFTQAEVLDKVPTCFLILGAVYFGLQLIGLACISEPPKPQTLFENKSEKAADAKSDVKHQVELVKVTTITTEKGLGIGRDNKGFEITDDTEKKGKLNADEMSSEKILTEINSDPDKPEDLGVLQAIKTSLTSRSFYVIWFTILFINIGMQFVTGLYKAYGQTFIEDDRFLAIVGSVAAVFNCSGRPAWGAVMDRAGFKVALRCISGGFAVMTGTLLLTEKMPKELFLVWICAIYFFFSGIWSLMPSALAKMLGPQNMAINYGLIYTGLVVAFISGSTVGTTLKSTIGWHGLFYISSGLGGLVFLVSFFFNGVDRFGKRV